MAKAVRKVAREIVTTETVTLTLSIREAEFLASLLLKVGGHDTHSPRKHSAAMSSALTEAGVRSGLFARRDGMPHAHELSSGTIMYDDFPEDWSADARG
jgi:hypothetical protein